MSTFTPSLKFSFKLSLFLIIPCCLKMFISEPYPAVIFPSGHHKVNIKKPIISREYLLHAYSNQKEIEVPLSRLLPNIPEQYYEYIIKNNLGFYNTELTSLDSKKLNKSLFPWQDSKRLKLDELKKYYEKNLMIDVDSLKLYITKYKRDQETGIPINHEIVSISNFIFK